MGSLYLKNGAISLQGGSLAGECKCCDVFASRIGYTHYTMGPLPTGVQWQFVETEDDLYLCSVVLTGKFNTCQSYTLNTSVADGLEDWVRAGGKFYYQNEYQGCGAASAAALAMSHAGSTMTAGNTFVAASGGEVNDGETLGGYTATDNGQFCVAGLTWRGGAADTCIGGTALIEAPPYITGGLQVRPGGTVLAGEKVGEGAVFLSGDSDLPLFQNTSGPDTWKAFIQRLATYSASALF